MIEQFMPSNQWAVVQVYLKGEEGEYFQSVLDRLDKTVKEMPKTYEQEYVDDKMVYLRYFSPVGEWLIMEKDMYDEQKQAFGYVNYYSMPESAEYGYIDITELVESPMVELDFHFEPTPFSKIKK